MDARMAAGSEHGTKDDNSQQRRRKRSSVDLRTRFFLPKQGSTMQSPELGTEVPSEGEALIQSLKGDHVYYAVTTWRAVARHDGDRDPVIVKETVG
jgi:hypothetical protein